MIKIRAAASPQVEGLGDWAIHGVDLYTELGGSATRARNFARFVCNNVNLWQKHIIKASLNTLQLHKYRQELYSPGNQRDVFWRTRCKSPQPSSQA